MVAHLLLRYIVLIFQSSYSKIPLDGSVGHHYVGDTEKAKDVGTGKEIPSRVEFFGVPLDVCVDAFHFCLEHIIGGLDSEGVNNGWSRHGHGMGTVQEAALPQGGAGVGRDTRMPTLNHTDASIVGKLVDGSDRNLVHGTAREAQVAGNVENVIWLIELRRRGRYNVPSQQSPPLVLDARNGLELSRIDAIRFVDVTTSVAKGERNSSVFQELFRHTASYLAGPKDQTALSFQ